MSIEKHKAFLDSLDGDKGLTEKLYSWYFDDDLEMVKCTINDGNTGRVLDYLFERIRRAESRHIERKQYTEQELRDLYFSTHRIDPFMSTWHSNRYSGWRECLTTIGALKAEP